YLSGARDTPGRRRPPVPPLSSRRRRRDRGNALGRRSRAQPRAPAPPDPRGPVAGPEGGRARASRGPDAGRLDPRVAGPRLADAADIVATLAQHPALKGLRPMLQDIHDPDWMLRAPVGQGLRTVEAFGLAFDALVRPAHLRNLRRLLANHPGLRVVVDHGAKPEIAAGRFGPWAADIRGLAEETRASVKLSGLVTEAGPDWSVERLRPYVEHLLDHFGPQR